VETEKLSSDARTKELPRVLLAVAFDMVSRTSLSRLVALNVSSVLALMLPLPCLKQQQKQHTKSVVIHR